MAAQRLAAQGGEARVRPAHTLHSSGLPDARQLISPQSEKSLLTEKLHRTSHTPTKAFSFY